MQIFPDRFPTTLLDVVDMDNLTAFAMDHAQDTSITHLSLRGTNSGYSGINFTVLKVLPALRTVIVLNTVTQDQFGQLCKLVALEELRIDDAGQLKHIDAVAALTALKGLSITVPMERASKPHTLASLAPIAALQQLMWLNIAAIKLTTGGLTPLTKIHTLCELAVIHTYTQELKDIKAANPNLMLDQ